MRVYYERTISRESNKSNLYLRMHNHILSVKMTYWIMKKRTRKERVCLLSLSYACFAAILNLFQKLDHFDSFLKKYIKKNARSKKINRFYHENLETLLYSKFDIFCLNKDFPNKAFVFIFFFCKTDIILIFLSKKKWYAIDISYFVWGQIVTNQELM